MKTLLILSLLFTLQSTEYGKPEELKGLKKVFVDTGGDVQSRERIAREFEKLGLTLLDSEEGAEIVLEFKAGKDSRLVGSVEDGTGSVHTKRYNTGEGRVFVVSGEHRRVVLSYEGSEVRPWESKPATSFGRMFAKAWKKANGVK